MLPTRPSVGMETHTLGGVWHLSDTLANLNSLITDANIASEQFVQQFVQGIAYQNPVLDKDLTSPPGGESAGDRYLVANGATGDWLGQDEKIAEALVNNPSSPSDWDFQEPTEGWTVWVLDENVQYNYNNAYPTGDWVPLPSIIRFADLDFTGSNITSIANRAHTDLHTPDGADDHLQYAKLAGRAGGQTLYGGTLTGEVLTLGGNITDGMVARIASGATKGLYFTGTGVNYIQGGPNGTDRMEIRANRASAYPRLELNQSAFLDCASGAACYLSRAGTSMLEMLPGVMRFKNVAGGIIYGSQQASGNLQLVSTDDATKGKVTLGNSHKIDFEESGGFPALYGDTTSTLVIAGKKTSGGLVFIGNYRDGINYDSKIELLTTTMLLSMNNAGHDIRFTFAGNDRFTIENDRVVVPSVSSLYLDGPTETKYLKWNGVSSRFEFNDNLYSTDFISALASLNSHETRHRFGGGDAISQLNENRNLTDYVGSTFFRGISYADGRLSIEKTSAPASYFIRCLDNNGYERLKFTSTGSLELRDVSNGLIFGIATDGEITTGSIDWTKLLNIPSSFTPSSHSIDPTSGFHTGTLPEASVTFSVAGHDHDGALSKKVSYANLLNIPLSFTPSAHPLDVVSGYHTGTLPWVDLNKTGSSLGDLATRQHSQLTNLSGTQGERNSHHPQTGATGEKYVTSIPMHRDSISSVLAVSVSALTRIARGSTINKADFTKTNMTTTIKLRFKVRQTNASYGGTYRIGYYVEGDDPISGTPTYGGTQTFNPGDTNWHFVEYDVTSSLPSSKCIAFFQIASDNVGNNLEFDLINGAELYVEQSIN